MFVLTLINGKEYQITDEERIGITAKMNVGGSIYLSRIQLTINTSSVSCIEPAGLSMRSVDRSKQFDGVLASGERVVKRFGNWYLADGDRDDEGNPCVQPDPDHYPEMRAGILPTPEEYERKYALLPAAEWPALLAGGDQERPQHDIDKRIGGGFGRIETREIPGPAV